MQSKARLKNEIVKKMRAKGMIMVSNEVGDHSNDPFVLRKGKASREMLDKIGFPKELLPKK